jgi:hypothetical protein
MSLRPHPFEEAYLRIRHITKDQATEMQDQMYLLVDILKALGPVFEGLKANSLHCTISVSVILSEKLRYRVTDFPNSVQMN